MSRLTELELEALKAEDSPAHLCIAMDCPHVNGRHIPCTSCAIANDKGFLDLCQDLQKLNTKKC